MGYSKRVPPLQSVTGFTGGTLDCQTELLQSEKVERTVWPDERKRLRLIGLCLPSLCYSRLVPYEVSTVSCWHDQTPEPE